MSPITLELVPLASLAGEQGLGGTSGPDLTGYLLVCAGLLALVCLLGLGFRKLAVRTLQHRAAQRSMQIVDVLPLGGKHKLAVVRCYDRTFLIGVGDKEIASIAELDAVITPARETPASRADLHGFATVLQRLRGPAVAKTPALSKEGILG